MGELILGLLRFVFECVLRLCATSIFLAIFFLLIWLIKSSIVEITGRDYVADLMEKINALANHHRL